MHEALRMLKSGRLQHFEEHFKTVLTFFAIEIALILWCSCDQSMPSYDTAAHRLNCVTAGELLAQPRLLAVGWYKSLFTISPLYPPFFYIVSGVIQNCIRCIKDAPMAANLFFVGLLFWSTYYCARAIGGKPREGKLAAFFMFLYPAVFMYAHTLLLDFASLAMVALAYANFFHWRKNPGVGQSIITGFAFGMATLTKNSAPAFLVGPLLVYLAEVSGGKFSRSGYSSSKIDNGRTAKDLLPFCIVIFSGFITLAPWLFFQGQTTFGFISNIQHEIGNERSISNPLIDSILSFCFNAILYLAYDMTLWNVGLPLTALALFAVNRWRDLSRKKTELLVFFFTGLCIASSFKWVHQFRYVLPLTLPVALLTARYVAQWSALLVARKIVLHCILVLATLQLLVGAFSPYPFNISRSLRQLLLPHVYCTFMQDLVQTPTFPIHPMLEPNWGQDWAISAILRTEKGVLSSFVVMPDLNELNTSTFVYKINLHHLPIKLIDARTYHVKGDLCKFDPDFAKTVDWYLLKTGIQGREFANKDSEVNYMKWCAWIKESSLYELSAQMPAPDGGQLELFCKLKAR